MRVVDGVGLSCLLSSLRLRAARQQHRRRRSCPCSGADGPGVGLYLPHCLSPVPGLCGASPPALSGLWRRRDGQAKQHRRGGRCGE